MFGVPTFPALVINKFREMKYMREHRASNKSKEPDVWKILSLLYQPVEEEQGKLQLVRSKVSIPKVI